MNPLRNEEAERAVLGLCLLEKKCLNEAREILTADDFTAEHAQLFTEICNQVDKGISYDIITVSEAFKTHEILTRSYIMSVVGAAPSEANLKHYINIVKNCSIARREFNLLEDRKKKLLEGADPKEIISSGIIADMELIRKDSRERVKHIKEVVFETFDGIERRMDKDLLGIPTGIGPLDKLTGGIIPDCVTTIAGRPGTGKTTLVEQIVLNLSKEHPGMFASLEMSSERLGIKMFANETGINSRKIDVSKRLQDQDWPKLSSALETLSARNLYIDDSVEMRASQIAVRARKLKSEVDLKYLVIDYLQIVAAENGHFENRREEINESLRIFKRLARELNLNVIILSQIVREIERRNDKKPTLADLKETGAIEEMSDIVLFLYKDDESEEKTRKLNHEDWYITPVNIAKNKYGPPDVTIDLLFKRDISKFVAMEYTQQPPLQQSSKGRDYY